MLPNRTVPLHWGLPPPRSSQPQAGPPACCRRLRGLIIPLLPVVADTTPCCGSALWCYCCHHSALQGSRPAAVLRALYAACLPRAADDSQPADVSGALAGLHLAPDGTFARCACLQPTPANLRLVPRWYTPSATCTPLRLALACPLRNKTPS